MKKRLRNTIGLVLLFLSSVLFVNQAQAQQGPPQMPNSSQIISMVKQLSESIDLNDAQSKKMYDLYTNHFQVMKDKMSSGRPSRNEMEKLKTEFESEVKSILSETQFEKFQDFMKKNAPKRERSNRPNR